nr:glycosyltransferase family 1 protein [Pseudomarimonas arenosa]
MVSETYPPEVNGVALTVANLRRHLQQDGHRVSLVRPRQSADAATPEAAEDALLVGGLPIPRYPGLRFGLPAGRALRQHWRAQRPDAIYVATEGPLGWSALRIARELGIPVASGLHTRFDDYMRRYGFGWLSPVALSWMRRFHNRAQATLVPTAELRRFLSNRGFQRVHELGRAVDCQLFDPRRRDPALRREWGATETEPVVIHVGRIAAEKNLPLLVQSVRAIQQQQPRARCVMVGDGPERHALQQANPDFLFAGVQRGEDLARHYASADLFLFPSQSETFGNVTLEAMASGVSLLAFDYGAAKAYIESELSGITLPLHDEAGFVEQACRLAANSELRQQLAEAARRRVADSDPRSLARQFLQLMSDLPRLEEAMA